METEFFDVGRSFCFTSMKMGEQSMGSTTFAATGHLTIHTDQVEQIF